MNFTGAPLTWHEAIKADFVEAQQSIGLSARMVNVAFGHSDASSWAYQLLAGEADIPGAQIERWVTLTGGLQALRYLAGKRDCDLVPRGIIQALDGDRVGATAAEAGRESSEALAAVYAAIEGDGRIDDVELRRCLKEIDEAVIELHTLRGQVTAKHLADSRDISGRARTLAEAEG